MIKNFIALTFFIFILGNNSFAQVQLSLWGGVNNSSFGGNPPEDAGYGDIRGLAAGANLDFHPSTDFVISLEPSFEQRGSTIDIHLEEGLEDTTLKFKVKQNYFGLGLMFKVNAGNFFVGSGLSAQLLSSAKLEYESQEKDIKDKFINYDALAFFNIGYKIPIGGPSLFVELRYIQGLINIRSDENESDTEIYLSNFKSTGLRLSTGILVHFKILIL
ncbi:MAG: PorT family protein [Ignavibacteriaceae bacterium]|nr:PorT family protein [Ignavibacteriaceae bacterium]